jgi:hypothetical protein
MDGEHIPQEGTTAPLARCRAALAAVGKVDDLYVVVSDGRPLMWTQHEAAARAYADIVGATVVDAASCALDKTQAP